MEKENPITEFKENVFFAVDAYIGEFIRKNVIMMVLLLVVIYHVYKTNEYQDKKLIQNVYNVRPIFQPLSTQKKETFYSPPHMDNLLTYNP